ncbi:natural resistance-associated macrophage family protein [Mycobacterium xenopi 3993]|nr:natural resistance-associated macrophage family protein [Mycobacterium xenopi 3993]
MLLAAAILGATVMPHAVYLHSGLARDRHGHPDAGPPGAGCCGSPAGMSRWR